jgi:hypothetical protein
MKEFGPYVEHGAQISADILVDLRCPVKVGCEGVEHSARPRVASRARKGQQRFQPVGLCGCYQDI